MPFTRVAFVSRLYRENTPACLASGCVGAVGGRKRPLRPILICLPNNPHQNAPHINTLPSGALGGPPTPILRPKMAFPAVFGPRCAWAMPKMRAPNYLPYRRGLSPSPESLAGAPLGGSPTHLASSVTFLPSRCRPPHTHRTVLVSAAS
jgi:hypothetical protein